MTRDVVILSELRQRLERQQGRVQSLGGFL